VLDYDDSRRKLQLKGELNLRYELGVSAYPMSLD